MDYSNEELEEAMDWAAMDGSTEESETAMDWAALDGSNEESEASHVLMRRFINHALHQFLVFIRLELFL